MCWFGSRIHKLRVIPVFRGGKWTYIEGYARPRKDRNLVPEAVGEGQPAFVLCFEKETAYSLQRAESGFRSFSRCPAPCFDPSRPSRKNRNDVGLGFFVMKDDDAFLLRLRRHFFRAKSRTKRSFFIATLHTVLMEGGNRTPCS